jgi:hypothetical protein
MIEQIINVVVPSLISLAGAYLIFKISMRPWQKMIQKYEPIVERTMSMLGQKSGQVRAVNTAEKMLMNDIINNEFPELKMILEKLSPETAEYLEQNPHVIPVLLERYLPLLQAITKRISQGQNQNQSYAVYG